MGEANLPAQEPQAHADTRVSRPDGDPRWPGGDQEPSAERSAQAHRLIWRVRDRETFAQLARQRRFRRGPISVAVSIPPETAPLGSSLPPARVAYSIGKRVGSAVVRNLVRRRLRAIVRARAARLRPGAAYLFAASPAAPGAPFAQLDGAVTQLLADTDSL